MMADDDDSVEFEDDLELQAWLKEHHVSEKMAASAASTLYDSGFVSSSTLVGINADSLRSYVDVPVAQYLSNKLKSRDAEEKERKSKKKKKKKKKSSRRDRSSRHLHESGFEEETFESSQTTSHSSKYGLVSEDSSGYDSQRDQEHLAQLQKLEQGEHEGMSKRTMEPPVSTSRQVKTTPTIPAQPYVTQVSSVSSTASRDPPSQVTSSPHMAPRGEAPSRPYVNERQDSWDSSSDDDSEDNNDSSLPPQYQRKEFLEQQRSILSQISVTAPNETPPESPVRVSTRKVTSQDDSFPRQSDKFLAQQEAIMNQIRTNTAPSVQRYDSSSPAGTRQHTAASHTVSLPPKYTAQSESNNKTVTYQVASSLPPRPMEQPPQAPKPTAPKASTPRASTAPRASSAPVTTSSTVTRQVTTTSRVASLAPQQHMGHSPSRITCPYCQASVVTRMHETIGTFAIIMIVVLLLLFWPIFWLPLVQSGCKDKEHICTNCNRKVGTAEADCSSC